MVHAGGLVLWRKGLCRKSDLLDRLGGTDRYAAVDSNHLGENIEDRLGLK